MLHGPRQTMPIATKRGVSGWLPAGEGMMLRAVARLSILDQSRSEMALGPCRR